MISQFLSYFISNSNFRVCYSNSFWYPHCGFLRVFSRWFLCIFRINSIQVCSRYFPAKTLERRKQKTVCHCPGRRPCVWPPSRRPNRRRVLLRFTSSSASLFVLSLNWELRIFLSLLLLLPLAVDWADQMIDLKSIREETRPGTWGERKWGQSSLVGFSFCGTRIEYFNTPS